jgi:hypothetical protein
MKKFIFLSVIGAGFVYCLDQSQALIKRVPTIKIMNQQNLNESGNKGKNQGPQKNECKELCKVVCCGPTIWMGLGFVCIKKLFESAGN